MYTLFVDLDGVLVDFESGVAAATGSLPHDQSVRTMWSKLARTPGFYEHLEWTEDGHELWDAVKHLEPTILTGLPLGKWAEPQKRAWVARELGPDVQVITCMSRDKAKKAREAAPNDATPILVDDRERLREAWEAMGGVFIHHTSARRSLDELSRYIPLD
jgi:hypothetical protein